MNRTASHPSERQRLSGGGWPSATTIPRCTARRGALLTELVIATVVLGVIASVLVPALRSMSQVRSATTFESLARIELNNVRERLLASGVPEETQSVEPSEWFQQRYARCELTVTPLDAASAAPDGSLVPLRLELTRDSADGTTGSAVSLIVWIPSRVEETP